MDNTRYGQSQKYRRTQTIQIMCFTIRNHFMVGGREGRLFWGSRSPVWTARVCNKTCKWALLLPKSYVQLGERKHKIFSNDCGMIKLFSSHTLDSVILSCFTCTCDEFPFVQLCTHCSSLAISFRINNLRTTNSVCIVPEHRVAIYQRLIGELERKRNRLKLVDMKGKEPNYDKGMKKSENLKIK